MKSQVRAFSRCAVILGSAWLAGCAADIGRGEARDEGEEYGVAEQGVLLPDDSEIDYATIYDPAAPMGIEIPPPNVTATLTIYRRNQPGKTMTVSTSATGVVSTTYGATPAASSGGGGGNTCLTDATFTKLGHKWTSTLRWAFNATVPVGTGLDATSAKAAISTAISNLTGEVNDCGRPDRVRATSANDPNTTLRASIKQKANASGSIKVTCKKPPADWQTNTAFKTNVVEFSTPGGGKYDLPNIFLAVTCTYVTETGSAISSDIRINSNHAWFTGATPPTGCTDKYHLESVMAHEFGHAYGLDHPGGSPPVDHPGLTMNYYSKPCDTSGATLNLGDALGLEDLYP